MLPVNVVVRRCLVRIVVHRVRFRDLRFCFGNRLLCILRLFLLFILFSIMMRSTLINIAENMVRIAFQTFNVADHFAGSVISVCRILFHRLEYYFLLSDSDIRINASRHLRIVIHLHERNCKRIIRIKRFFACKHLVQYDTH